jgi:hypothetical protein
MGLTYHDIKRLWDARLAGCSILTLSHQQLFLHPAELQTLRRDYHDRSPSPAGGIALANYQFGEYADRFFKEFLDARTVEVLDYSDYEGANILHDMNTPVPESLHERFDAVIEAGSLEHIYNFPIAIRNLMLMAKVGGVVFITTPANNLCGHGLYQFSPELMYRIFSLENGFETPKVVFLEAKYPWVELTPIRAAYTVVDPARIGSRVGLQSKRPVLMMVESKRISAVSPLRTYPQQSDYVVAWARERSPATSGRAVKSFLKRVYAKLPLLWRNIVCGHRTAWQYSFRNRRFYRKVR